MITKSLKTKIFLYQSQRKCIYQDTYCGQDVPDSIPVWLFVEYFPQVKMLVTKFKETIEYLSSQSPGSSILFSFPPWRNDFLSESLQSFLYLREPLAQRNRDLTKPRDRLNLLSENEAGVQIVQP